MSQDAYESALLAWKAAQGVADANGRDVTAEEIMLREDAADPSTAYCWRCGHPFPVSTMQVVTDPHLQYDECPYDTSGYIPRQFRVRACARCFKEDESD